MTIEQQNKIAYNIGMLCIVLALGLVVVAGAIRQVNVQFVLNDSTVCVTPPEEV